MTAHPKAALQGYCEYLQRLVGEWNAPSLSVAVVVRKEVVFADAFGVRDPAANLPATPNTLYAVGSCTKAYTSLAVVMLVDDGVVEWDQPLRNYLPWFRMFDPYATDHLTVRDMLCHRSGLPRHDFVWYNSDLSRRALTERIRYLEPNLGFREALQYNNLMYMTLGLLVGELTNGTWEGFVSNRILAPLGMSSANLSVVDCLKSSDLAVPCVNFAGPIQPIPFRDMTPIAPAGAVNSNAVDMARWLRLHLNKGVVDGQRLVSETNLALTHTPQVVTRPEHGDVPIAEAGDFAAYAMGWYAKTYRGRTWHEHGGGIDRFSGLVSMLPHEGIGVVAMTNTLESWVCVVAVLDAFDRLLGVERVGGSSTLLGHYYRMIEAMIAEWPGDAEATEGDPPTQPLSTYAGSYVHPGNGEFTVRKEGEVLRSLYNRVDYPLEHISSDVFRLQLEAMPLKFRVTFRTDASGAVGSLAIPFEPTVKDIVFARQPTHGRPGRAWDAEAGVPPGMQTLLPGNWCLRE
jgi:CubicO group peptidase (beta-lactamase class C family)